MKKTKGAAQKGEKQAEEQGDNNHGSSCGAGNAACGSSSHTDCAWCGAKEGSIPGILKHNQCSRCKLTFYCSKNCQRRHWREGGHKQNCVAPADRRASAALDAARIAQKVNFEQGRSQSAKASLAGGKGITGSDDIKGKKEKKKSQAAGNNKAAADAGDESDECAMCLESLASAKVLRLPCSHVYHAECVGKLREFGIKQVCPLCRADLPPGPEQLFDDAMRRYTVLYRRYSQGTEDTPWRIRSVEDRGYAEKMVHMLEEAADQGNANSQYTLGCMYNNGHGVAQDDSVAMKWHRMAADQGLVQAQFNLGVMYDNGQGVPQDDSAAMKWHRMAADQGDAQSQHNLGVMYNNGQGVAQDYSAAMKWFRMAADQGYAQAQANLGGMYESGHGAAQDYSAAMKWFLMAAVQGDANAQANLGAMYKNGDGVAQNYSAAMKWYRMAADQGHAQAQFNIGGMYYEGQSVPQNTSEALRWLHKAQVKGHDNAKQVMQMIMQKLRETRASQ